MRLGNQSTGKRSKLSYTSLHQTEGPSHCLLSLPIHNWSAVEVEDTAEVADLSESRSHRSPGCCPSHHVAVVWWQHVAPRWKEGLFSSQSLPTMDHLTLANETKITDPLLE